MAPAAVSGTLIQSNSSFDCFAFLVYSGRSDSASLDGTFILWTTYVVHCAGGPNYLIPSKKERLENEYYCNDFTNLQICISNYIIKPHNLIILF